MSSRVRGIAGHRYPFNEANVNRLATARLVTTPSSEPLRFDKIKLRPRKDVILGTDVILAGPARLLQQLLVDPKSSSLRAAFGLGPGEKYVVPPSVELVYDPTVSKKITTGCSVDGAGTPYCCIVFPFLLRLTATKMCRALARRFQRARR